MKEISYISKNLDDKQHKLQFKKSLIISGKRKIKEISDEQKVFFQKKNNCFFT